MQSSDELSNTQRVSESASQPPKSSVLRRSSDGRIVKDFLHEPLISFMYVQGSRAVPERHAFLFSELWILSFRERLRCGGLLGTGGLDVQKSDAQKTQRRNHCAHNPICCLSPIVSLPRSAKPYGPEYENLSAEFETDWSRLRLAIAISVSRFGKL